MDNNEKLTRRERQLMDVLFTLGTGTVNDVRDLLSEPLSYAAARSALTRLVNKRELKITQDGPRYIYSPATKMSKVRQSAFKKIKDTLFAGSSIKTMTALLGESADDLSMEELEELEELVAETKRRKECENDQ